MPPVTATYAWEYWYAVRGVEEGISLSDGYIKQLFDDGDMFVFAAMMVRTDKDSHNTDTVNDFMARRSAAREDGWLVKFMRSQSRLDWLEQNDPVWGPAVTQFLEWSAAGWPSGLDEESR